MTSASQLAPSIIHKESEVVEEEEGEEYLWQPAVALLCERGGRCTVVVATVADVTADEVAAAVDVAQGLAATHALSRTMPTLDHALFP